MVEMSNVRALRVDRQRRAGIVRRIAYRARGRDGRATDSCFDPVDLEAVCNACDPAAH